MTYMVFGDMTLGTYVDWQVSHILGDEAVVLVVFLISI